MRRKNTCVDVSVSEACNFIKKETTAEVFSCDFCEIFKNIFTIEKPPVAASVKIYQLKIISK